MKFMNLTDAKNELLAGRARNIRAFIKLMVAGECE